MHGSRGRGRGLTDLWICWWVFPSFYTLFGIIFVPLTRVMPPPSPAKTTAQIVVFFHAHALAIQVGFALLMLAIGGGSILNGLIAYQMRRMTIDPVFIFRGGPFAWNGAISFWEGTALFGVYIACLIMASRTAIQRQRPGHEIAE